MRGYKVICDTEGIEIEDKSLFFKKLEDCIEYRDTLGKESEYKIIKIKAHKEKEGTLGRFISDNIKVIRTMEESEIKVFLEKGYKGLMIYMAKSNFLSFMVDIVLSFIFEVLFEIFFEVLAELFFKAIFGLIEAIFDGL